MCLVNATILIWFLPLSPLFILLPWRKWSTHKVGDSLLRSSIQRGSQTSLCLRQPGCSSTDCGSAFSYSCNSRYFYPPGKSVAQLPHSSLSITLLVLGPGVLGELTLTPWLSSECFCSCIDWLYQGLNYPSSSVDLISNTMPYWRKDISPLHVLCAHIRLLMNPSKWIRLKEIFLYMGNNCFLKVFSWHHLSQLP